MTTLHAALVAGPVNAAPRRCKLGRIIDDQTSDDVRPHFLAAIGDPVAWPAERLAQVIRQSSLNVSASQIRSHRRAGCACDPAA